jgi:hypothetical protein
MKELRAYKFGRFVCSNKKTKVSRIFLYCHYPSSSLMNYNLHQLPVDSANDIVSFMDNDTMFAVLSAYRPLLRNQFLLAN